MSPSRPKFCVDILLYPEDGRWTAHCLHFDLVEEGATREEAQDAIIDVIRAHVEYAIENDNLENLFHPAPANAWRMFLQADYLGDVPIPISTEDGDSLLTQVVAQKAALEARQAC